MAGRSPPSDPSASPRFRLVNVTTYRCRALSQFQHTDGVVTPMLLRCEIQDAEER